MQKGKTEWSRLIQLTEAQLKESASQDADAPLLTERELLQFKPALLQREKTRSTTQGTQNNS